ncbi:MAG: DUF4830 domain-containing protein [Oscillospiraceae bacterium]|jgi:hypothetical protein|nr:DUF4830 domain-containing protein [Oscillospiraceae bacterium]
MFVFTAKLNRKKAVLITAGLAVVLALIVIAVHAASGGKKADMHPSESGIRGVEDIVAYLASLGWQVESEPIETQSIVIPRRFNGVYADYIKLQKEQGYPIENYAGMQAVRYSFRVTNYPTGEKDIVADVVLFGQEIIAGDVQSTASDGFMRPLRSYGA